MEKWFVSGRKADFDAWAKEFGISPVLARIIRNRDITDPEKVRKYLYGTLEDCYSPWLLHGMKQAVSVILECIDQKIPIRVIGDYDVDGICSSYILTKGLSSLGAAADTAIPHRQHDGYGLNEHLIEEAAGSGIGLIVTCDNGIAAAPQIALAEKYGIRVVVTDHHEVPFMTDEAGMRKELLPPAEAVIDPKQEACAYPFREICGAVVAYKLIQALFMRRKCAAAETLMEEFLQFAALATVCDVMELKDENRILVKEGLALMRKAQNPGLRALMEVSGIEASGLSAYHLGFVIGPCLNATGRLDTAQRALELLRADTKREAMRLAEELKELNDSRKNLTAKGVEEAEIYLQEKGLLQDAVYVIYLPGLHESLAGIVAGRIREKYHHPVFVLTLGEEGVKGSGRSIDAYHMYEHMTAVKECFSKFGGHKKAAGLTLLRIHDRPEEDVEAFRKLLNASSGLTEEDFIPKVLIDVPLPLEYADMPLAKSLSLLEPCGTGNPRPLFAQKNLHFIRGRLMGTRQNCARFHVRTPDGAEGELVFFGDLEQFNLFLNEKYGQGSAERLYSGKCDYLVSVTYQLGIHTYAGSEKLQFVMQNYC